MKERIKTLILIFLVLTTLYLMGLLWLEVPNADVFLSGEEAKTSVSETLTKTFSPDRMLINFGEDNHTMGIQMNTVWPIYRELLDQTFVVHRDNTNIWRSLKEEEYLDLQKKPSVIFYLDSEITRRLFYAVFRLENEREQIGQQVQELYFPANGSSMVIHSEKGYFSIALSDVSIAEMEKNFHQMRRSSFYVPYRSLREIYGVNNTVYVPTEGYPIEQLRLRKNGVNELSFEAEKAFVESVMGQSINVMHIIDEENGKLFVYNEESFHIGEDGIMTYQNRSESRGEKRDLLASLEATSDFLYNKIDIGENISYQTLSEVTMGGKEGYRLTFNLSAGGYEIIPYNKNGYDSTIIMDVLENQVDNFRLIYRLSPKEKGSINVERCKTLTFDEILEKDEGYFLQELGMEGKSRRELLQELSKFTVIFLDDISKDDSPLALGYGLTFGKKTFYVNAQDGTIIQE